jgi:tetratricopeptide (TPR) repeat protein
MALGASVEQVMRKRLGLFAWALGGLVVAVAAYFLIDDTQDYDNCNSMLVAQEYDKAIILCDLRLQSENLSDDQRAAAFVNRGLAYFAKGEDDHALADYDRAIQLKPDFDSAYVRRGLAYHDRGQYDRAIADFDQAIRLRPDNVDAYDGRASAAYQDGAYDAALHDLDWLIARRPRDVPTYIKRASTYSKLEDHDRAIADIDRAMELAPDDAVVWYARGTTYYLKGDFDRAFEAYDRAIAIKPDSADFYLGRGGIHVIRSDFDRAMADYDKAVELKPDDARLWRLKGLAEFLRADYEAAAGAFTHSQRIKRTDLYNVMLLHLARRHVNEKGISEEDVPGDKVDLSKWPGPIVLYFLGRISKEKAIQAADDPDARIARARQCEAEYYIGQLDLAEGRLSEARQRFEHDLQICPPSLLEMSGARVALSRM